MISNLKTKVLLSICQLVCMILIGIAIVYRVKALEDDNIKSIFGLMFIYITLYASDTK